MVTGGWSALCGNSHPLSIFFFFRISLLFDLFFEGIVQDNPVGTGYSFVEEGDADLFVKTDDEAASDLTTLLEKVFNRNESLQKSPLYIVAESYGGKFAVTLGLSALKAIEAGKLKLILGGNH